MSTTPRGPSRRWNWFAAPPRPRAEARGRSDGPTQVYLLVHQYGRRFKIGISGNVHARSRVLPEASGIDLTRSLAVTLPSRQRARQVERALHKALAPMGITFDVKHDGFTEWFDMAALPAAIRLLRAIPVDGRVDFMLHPRPLPSEETPLEAPQPDPALAAAIHNVAVVERAAQTWLMVAHELPVSQRQAVGTSRTELVVHGFRTAYSEGLVVLRMKIQDCEAYALKRSATGSAVVGLVSTMRYDSHRRDDLVLALNDLGHLRGLPGRQRVKQRLAQALDDLRVAAA